MCSTVARPGKRTADLTTRDAAAVENACTPLREIFRARSSLSLPPTSRADEARSVQRALVSVIASGGALWRPSTAVLVRDLADACARSAVRSRAARRDRRELIRPRGRRTVVSSAHAHSPRRSVWCATLGSCGRMCSVVICWFSRVWYRSSDGRRKTGTRSRRGLHPDA